MLSESTPKPQRRLPWARLLVVTCATLVLLPCLCLLGSVAFLNAQRSGKFSRWRSLEAPPGNGVEIVTGDTYVVYVRAAAGDVYGCEHQRKVTADNCWVETQEPLGIDPNTAFDERLFQDDVEPPPGMAVDTLDVTVWQVASAHETRYVLLQDGTVWKWEFSRVGYSSLIIVVLGLLAGGVLAIVLVVILWSGVGLRSLWQRLTRPSPDVSG